MVEVHSTLIRESTRQSWRLAAEAWCCRRHALAGELALMHRHGLTVTSARLNRFGGFDIEGRDNSGQELRYVSMAFAVENTAKKIYVRTNH